MIGLKWEDVDLPAGTLRVQRQLQRRRARCTDCAAEEEEIKGTKLDRVGDEDLKLERVQAPVQDQAS